MGHQVHHLQPEHAGAVFVQTPRDVALADDARPPVAVHHDHGPDTPLRQEVARESSIAV